MKKGGYIVSACLVGRRCRYDGEDKSHSGVVRFLRRRKYLALCPEMLAGWKSPRPAVELRGGGAAQVSEGVARIKDARGRDRTETLIRGVHRALRRAVAFEAREAILKEKSPSCGVERVYRDGRLGRGEGLFTYWLRKNGISVRSEEELSAKRAAKP
ncbi:MAG: DUF523 domain-containing protein [Deltaproteobacteria bacterium]|nr:DUF523 domain-containing protein [Deltaproteobacteria bacterium]